jgi:ribosomal protein L36
MKERAKNGDIFSHARREAILDTIRDTNGAASSDQLEQAARKAESKSIEKVGDESEKKFLKYVKRTKNIMFVQNAHPTDDVYGGVDMWIRFNKEEQLPDLPVQVKSSFEDVDTFRENSNYIKRNGIEVVINCGPRISDEDFNRQFNNEIRRIRASLKDNPSLLNPNKR